MHDELPFAMPALLEGVPHDARVLVVTESLMPMPLDPWLAPRAARVLCVWPEKLLASRPLDSRERFLAQLRLERLERDGRRFTPQRYAQELERATHLLLINAAPREYAIPDTDLVPVRSHGRPDAPAASLFEVRPRTASR